MKLRVIFQSIVIGAVIVFIPLLSGCGRSEEKKTTPPGASARGTPAEKEDVISRYRQKGIKPREARYWRKWD